MDNIKKFLVRFSGLLVTSSLLIPSVPFAMDSDTAQDPSKTNSRKRSNNPITKQDSQKKTKIEDSNKYTNEDLERYFQEHRNEMKLASKKAGKRLNLNPPKSKKNQK